MGMSGELAKKVIDNKKGVVINFMGGISYEWNPLDSLKMVTASSIFGEPQYYRNGEFAGMTIKDGVYGVDRIFTEYSIKALDKYKGMKTSELMENVIDEALDYDYESVLAWAGVLRSEFLMRLNPQVIMVRAAMHENRIAWTAKNPGKFYEYNTVVMQRGDDVINQITYFLFCNGGKSKCPNLLKRSWAKKLESLTPYEVNKYKGHGIGLINCVRITHANNSLIDRVMHDESIIVPESSVIWEKLRSEGKSWAEIVENVNMPHMALLRNLRGIFKEVSDSSIQSRLLAQLKNGVEKGKQFPFRYMSAYNAVIREDDVHGKQGILNSLADCIDLSCKHLPALKGCNAFLTDNSGSAWGTCTSEYGTFTVAKINNLSSVIGAANSEKGIVFKFGDRVRRFPVNSKDKILFKAEEISEERYSDVGGDTEHGIWLFFKEALDENVWWDNIFIYSDMQAGTGELYGKMGEYSDYSVKGNRRYIDVAKLINVYRQKINPKVNVYCIQTAGYNNMLVPQNGYRTNILYGWTGKELLYANAINRFWDEKDKNAL